MAGPIVVNNPVTLLQYTTAPIEDVYLTCYSTAFELTPSTEEIDVGVFCAPALSDLGRTTWTAVLFLLWEPALYAALSQHIGHQGVFKLLNAAGQAGTVSFQTKFAAQPWGRFELGQRVEVELPLAVLSTPVYTP
jgi:hypothetical protein